MIKRKSAMRREATKNMRAGDGVIVNDHILEKDEMQTNCRLFTRMTIEPGASIGYHAHAEEEDIYYILSGIATVCDNGETRTLYPGEVIFTGDGDSHSIANKGEVPVELIDVILTYATPAK